MNTVHQVLAHIEASNFQQALEIVEIILSSEPSNTNARLMQAMAYRKLGKITDAQQSFIKALEFDSNNANAWGNYANFLHQEKLDSQLTIKSYYQKALEIDPTNAVIWNNYGLFCLDCHFIYDAISAFERAVTFNSSVESYWIDLGISHFQLNQNTQSIFCYERALAINPNSQKAKYNLSLVLLRTQQYDLAWPLYNYRFEISTKLIRQFDHIPPLKRMDELKGRSLLIWAEQGFGDTLQFVRFLRHFDTDASKVTLFCQAELVTLLSHNFPNIHIVSEIEHGEIFDYQTPLLGLPFFITNSSALLCRYPAYLKPHSPHQVTQLQATRLATTHALQIALCCSGNPGHKEDVDRSIAMQHFDCLHEYGLVTLMQKDIRESDQPFYSNSEFNYLGHQLHSFNDTADFLTGFDLVITVDTALAHLAGALGVPTYCLLSLNSDWRWGVHGRISPYTSVKTIVQPVLGDWVSVIQELQEQLKKHHYSFNNK